MEGSTMTKHVRETRVLVLYTGGTIGMKKTDGGELSREVFDRRLIVAYALRADMMLGIFDYKFKLVHNRCVKLCFNRISTENRLPADANQTPSNAVRWRIQEDRPDGKIERYKLRGWQQHARLKLFTGRISYAVSLSCFVLSIWAVWWIVCFL